MLRPADKMMQIIILAEENVFNGEPTDFKDKLDDENKNVNFFVSIVEYTMRNRVWS